MKIKDSIVNEKNESFLLHGVTGSGKTEVYLQAVSEALNQGKTSIVLVPEIALTRQVVQRSISLGAGLLSAFFTEALLNDLNALGGVLIAAIGTNILGITRIKVASLLPGVFVIVIIVKLGIAVGLLT